MQSIKRQKIGVGYWPSAYGRSFQKRAVVYLINGKAYTRDTHGNAFETDLQGYKMLNFNTGDLGGFYEVGLISKHEPYTKL